MTRLTFNLEEEIGLLNQYGIDCDELMLARTILILQDDDNEELLKEYIEALHESGRKLHDIFRSLQEKGLILKSYKIPRGEGDMFDPREIPMNKGFMKSIYRCSYEMGKELFNEYPSTTVINGSLVMLRGVSKHFDSLEECFMKYAKAIRWNDERHKEILELVRWAKERNLLQQSLSSFVVNNAWLDLQSVRDGEGMNINFDTVKVL